MSCRSICDFSFLLPYFLGLLVVYSTLTHHWVIAFRRHLRTVCRACWYSVPRLVDGVYNTNFSISGVRPRHAFAVARIYYSRSLLRFRI